MLHNSKMSLKQKLSEDIKIAMKSADPLTVGVLRMVISNVKNKEIEKKISEAPDEDVMAVLLNEAKKRRESIEIFEKNNRADLANKEKAELVIIQKYLPKQMSEAEVEAAVDVIIKKTGLKEFGPLMKEVSKELKGKADGQLVAKIVKSKLG